MKPFITILLLFAFNANAQTAKTATDFLNRGVKKVKSNDIIGAIYDYTKSINLNPKNPLVYLNRGKCKWILKDYQEAILDFSKAIELDPYYLDAFDCRARCKKEIEDYQGALSDYIKIKNYSQGSFISIYYEIARCKEELGDYHGAIWDYQVQISENFNDYWNRMSYYSIFRLKQRLGLIDEACYNLKKAVELGMKIYEMDNEFIKKSCN